MAFKNNKGFSLIEIIIAIAVLTLLLTPIMRQFAQTLEVSRLAKEQQYVNEEAVYTLEKAQVSSDEELKAEYGTPTSAEITCELTDVSGSSIIASGATITYNRDVYDLNQVEVGARNTVYNKSLVVDDISAQINGFKVSATEGCNIKYSGFSEAEKNALIAAGYEFTNEGSCVKYDANGAITSIVCETTPYVGNPNNANLGNIQNIDVNTVALIDGITARYDDQADKALYAYAMEALKEWDYDSWDQAMNHTDGSGLYDTNNYKDKLINKVTKFYIEEGTDATKGKYYYIQAEVYYSCSFTLNKTSSTGTATSEKKSFSKDLKYPVFSQTFYMDECPAIFFEYQPYVNSISGSEGSYSVQYAANDYIIVESEVEDAKIYMYKPANDAYTMANGGSVYEDTLKNPDGTVASDFEDINAVYKYETSISGSNQPVKIHLSKMYEESKNVTIVTNLNIAENFVCDSEVSTYAAAIKKQSKKSGMTEGIKDFCKEKNGVKYIIPINEDTRTNNRLKSVTVTMTPDTANTNTVSLTGAKGEK